MNAVENLKSRKQAHEDTSHVQHLQLKTNLICCVECADDFDEDNWTRRECELLPRSKLIVALVNNLFPVLVIYRRFDIETVRSIIAIPEQQPQRTNAIGLAKLNNNESTPLKTNVQFEYNSYSNNCEILTQLMARVTRIPIVILSVAI